MDNWGSKARITVAFGPVIEKVLEFAAKDFTILRDEQDEKDIVVTKHIIDGNTYMVSNEGGIDTEHLVAVLMSLDTHLQHTPQEQIEERIDFPDYMCAKPFHVLVPIKCRCSLASCIHTDVYRYTYTTNNCVVEGYYVRPS